MEARNDCSELAYNGIYLDGLPSKSTAYPDLHLDDDPSESLLKVGGLPTLTVQSQPIMGYTLMATRGDQQPIRVFTLTVTLRRVS